MDIYPNIYYVYFYLRSKDSATAKAGTPYYVGKGKGNRVFDTQRSTSIPTDHSKIILVEQDLSELQAFILERYYIRWFGRKDIGTGILLNRTNGGEGTSGLKHSQNTRKKMSNSQTGKKFPNRGKKGKIPWNKGKYLSNATKIKMKTSNKGKSRMKGKFHSEETKKKMSISRKGKTHSQISKIKMSIAQKGKIISEETKKKMSIAQKGTTKSEETKKKMSEKKKGIPTQKTTCPHCGKTGGKGAMERWHFDNCKVFLAD